MLMPNGEAIPEKVIGSNGKLRPIRPQERVFALAFGLPDSPTFANGTQSMLKANPSLSQSVAASMASEYLDRPHVSNTIATIMQKAGLGIEVRADRLKDIISHRDIGKVVSKTTRSEDGEAVTETTHGPGYKDMLKAIDVANKMDGLYAKNQGAVDVAVEEYRSLSKRFFQPQRRASPPIDPTVNSPVASKEGPAINDVAPTHSRRRQRRAAPPAEPAPQAPGGGGQPESREDVVSLSPTADKEINKGGS